MGFERIGRTGYYGLSDCEITFQPNSPVLKTFSAALLRGLTPIDSGMGRPYVTFRPKEMRQKMLTSWRWPIRASELS
jgi:hypothetical protein